MIQIFNASQNHVRGIVKVCSDGYQATYTEIHSTEYIRILRSEINNVY